jgi:hypothetical protein
MTWSIVARDRTGAFGVAIASRFFAVGVLCPHVRHGFSFFLSPRYAYRARRRQRRLQGIDCRSEYSPVAILLPVHFLVCASRDVTDHAGIAQP